MNMNDAILLTNTWSNMNVLLHGRSWVRTKECRDGLRFLMPNAGFCYIDGKSLKVNFPGSDTEIDSTDFILTVDSEKLVRKEIEDLKWKFPLLEGAVESLTKRLEAK